MKNQIIQLVGLNSIYRNVFAIQNNGDLKIQTGYIEHNCLEVPVWRPYKSDGFYSNEWWHLIYVLKIGHSYMRYELIKYQEDEITALLPEANLVLHSSIRDYLNRIKKKNK